MSAEILINELNKIIELADKMKSAKPEDLEDGEYDSIIRDFIARIVCDNLIVKTFERSCKSYFDNPHITEAEKRVFLEGYYQLTNSKYVGYMQIDGDYYADYPDYFILKELFSSPLFQTIPTTLVAIDIVRRYEGKLDGILNDIFDTLPEWCEDGIPDIDVIIKYLSIVLARIYNNGLLSIVERVYITENYIQQFNNLDRLAEAQRAKNYALEVLKDYIESATLCILAGYVYNLVLEGERHFPIIKITYSNKLKTREMRAFANNIYGSFNRGKDWRKVCCKFVMDVFNEPYQSVEASTMYKRMTEKSPIIKSEKI